VVSPPRGFALDGTCRTVTVPSVREDRTTEREVVDAFERAPSPGEGVSFTVMNVPDVV
jgi:hypothetical protein